MASSFLSVPNSYALSDNVIGSVVQRVTPFHNRLDDGCRAFTPAHRPTSGEYLQHDTTIGHKRLPPLEPPANAAAVDELTKDRIMRVTASRRERCRINQARYRKRQRIYAEDLTQGIEQMKDEIQKLEMKRQTILRCTLTNDNVWIVATEYFRLFRRGYLAPKKTQSHAQLDFLQTTMASDVTDGPVCGPDAILKHWKLLSMYHGDLEVKLRGLHQDGASDSILAKTRVSLTVTDNTLRNIYPHLSSGNKINAYEDSEAASSLAAKLLNQRLMMHGSVRFFWDDQRGRVVRMESKVDFMSAMVNLLGNLDDVVSVFEKAAISPEGRIIDHSRDSYFVVFTPPPSKRDWWSIY
ncbi:unnamed protein product [Phytophthora fragariaefolia]|uniref:Unnamed protein product n=1 Tax=Phytophthora fragariaefolia TaxID=1490495 RepID=A0A9W6UB29_9STRA|nr:unnamed protein product [Phytophthora fragariaefolia]